MLSFFAPFGEEAETARLLLGTIVSHRPIADSGCSVKLFAISSFQDIVLQLGSLNMQVIFVFFIACAHIIFLFLAYRTGVVGLQLPYMSKIAIWLGCSSGAAGIAYYFTCSGLWVLKTRVPKLIFALVATCISLYVGVFWAFNVLGT